MQRGCFVPLSYGDRKLNWIRLFIGSLSSVFLGIGFLGRLQRDGTDSEIFLGGFADPFRSMVMEMDRLHSKIVSSISEAVGSDFSALEVTDSLMAVGFSLLGLAWLHGRRMRGKEACASSEPAEGRLAFKSRRQSRRRGRALARQGEYESAAEVCWEVGDLDAAVQYFINADLPIRAAEVRYEQGRRLEAAGLLAQAHEYDRAGALFAQEHDWDQAADCYLKLNKWESAAEMQESGGHLREAAAGYEQAELFGEASRLWLKVSRWDRAAFCLEEILKDGQRGGFGERTQSKKEHDLAKRVADLYQRAGTPEKGLLVLEQAGCWIEAGELATLIEADSRAAQAFQNAGDSVRCAEALERLGDEKSAARQRAGYYRDQEKLELAAEHLVKAGDHAEAGDLYQLNSDFAAAAVCYERQSDWPAAAEMFERSGDRSSAAACYERAGNFERAAECHAELGQELQRAESLERGGQYLRAARIYCEQGQEEDGVSALQKLSSFDENFMEGTAFLADLFCRRDQPELGVHALEAAIGESEIDRINIVAYHALACALEQCGDWRRCVGLFEKILSLDIAYGDVDQKLAAAREQVIKLDQASSQPEGSLWDGVDVRDTRYQVKNELGRGGMGIVYEAFDTLLDRSVAFKVLPRTLNHCGPSGKHFLREAKAAAKLNHPNIVTVYDAGKQASQFYIAMEYVDGITFKQILSRRGPLGPRGALRVALELCDAIAYAHTQRVIHRDIKPANIMWTRDQKTKIMDFGLAKVMEEVRQQTTAVAGTPYYMSPEQTLGKNVDHRTDIYALGVTLFEILTGTVPFPEGDLSYHHIHTPAPDVRERLPSIPESVAQLIARCLDKDPECRFQSAEEMKGRIREIA